MVQCGCREEGAEEFGEKGEPFLGGQRAQHICDYRVGGEDFAEEIDGLGDVFYKRLPEQS